MSTTTEAIDPRANARIDAEIFSFLLSIVTGHPLTLIITDNDSRSGVAAIKRLQARYVPSGRDYVLGLQAQLRNIAWTSADCIDTFTSRLATIIAHLSRCGIDVPADELRLIVANALPSEFDLVMRFILQEQPSPSLSAITSRLIQEERLINMRRPSRTSNAALAISHNFPNASSSSSASAAACCPPRSHIICAFCGIKGHCAQICFKLANAKKHKLIDTQSVIQRLAGDRKRKASSTSFGNRPKRSDTDVDDLALYCGSDLSTPDVSVTSIEWIADTGATSHVTALRSVFATYTEASTTIVAANDQHLRVVGKGDIVLLVATLGDGGQVRLTLKDVLHVPEVKFNLLALGNVVKRNASVTISPQASFISFGDGRTRILLDTRASGHLVLCSVPAVCSTALAVEAASQKTSRLLHNKLGHRHIVTCEPCELAKSTRVSVPKQSNPRTAEPCQLLYIDIAGPLEVDDLRGMRYAVSVVDDNTRFTWTFLIKRKSDVCHVLAKLRVDRHMRHGLRGATLQSDSDMVFKAMEFRSVCTDFGVVQRFSPPHTQAKNGVVERVFRTLFETTRAMLLAAGLPKPYWGLAVKHATLVHNISPKQRLSGATPFHALTGHAFPADVLRPFGVPAFVHVEKTGRAKLDDRAKKGVYIGFSHEDQANLVFFPDTNRVVSTIHVSFGIVEAPEPAPSASAGERLALPMPAPNATATPSEQPPDLVNSDVDTNDDEDPLLADIGSETAWTASAAPCAGGAGETNVHATPVSSPTMPSIDSASAHCDPPSSTALAIEPSSIKQALESPEADEWRTAILNEMVAMRENSVFEEVVAEDVPRGTKLLQSMIIFKKKLDDKGNVVKYKARWVAKGYSQTKGVNYDETFAPTATITAIRLLLSMACQRGMNIQQMDVTTAFLNAPIDHEIYVRPPPLPELFADGVVLKLRRGLYGLKQSPRLWNNTLDKWLREYGLAQTESDSCVYTMARVPDRLLWVAVYVDDLLIFADNDKDMAAFKSGMSARFSMKDLGEPDLCLGIKITYDRAARRLTLSQEHYVRHVLATFAMADCKPVGTPLCTGYIDAPADQAVPMPDVPFRPLMGSLLYAATMTRPDISAAVSILCRHMKHYNADHWTAAKHLLRYLRGTLAYTIVYDGSAPPSDITQLHGYSDASYGSDSATARSRTGFVMLCAGGPVAWSSKLQSVVATTAAEAEYMALTATAQETIFLRQLIVEIAHDSGERTEKELPPTLVYTDNQPALHVANRSSTRMRHIRIKQHFIRHCVGEGLIELRYCPTGEMVADCLTKILGKPKTEQFARALFGPNSVT